MRDGLEEGVLQLVERTESSGGLPLDLERASEVLLRLLQARDVEHHARPEAGVAVLVAHDLRLVQDPHDPSVCATHPVLDRERLQRPFGAFVLRVHALSIVGMHQLEPHPTGHEVVRRDTEHLLDTRARVQRDIILPDHVHVDDGRDLFDERAVELLGLA